MKDIYQIQLRIAYIATQWITVHTCMCMYAYKKQVYIKLQLPKNSVSAVLILLANTDTSPPIFSIILSKA